MPRAGRSRVRQYSLEFKLKAVKLSQLPGVEVQAVADALEIHPFTLSRWRKEARDGVLRGRAPLPKAVTVPARQPGEATTGAAAQVCGARGGARAPKHTHPVHLRTKTDVFAFIDETRGRFGVTRLCRLFAVTRFPRFVTAYPGGLK